MQKEDMDEFVRVIKDNPGKQSYKVRLVDKVGNKACNMTPLKGKKTFDTINAHEVLPLLEKMPFVDFDLKWFLLRFEKKLLSLQPENE